VYHADLLEQKNNAMVWGEIFLALESNFSGNGVKEYDSTARQA
jgi:hypothetical protein